jgi:hypothetical protein
MASRGPTTPLLLGPDELKVVGLASGCALLVAALSSHFRDRDFDVFYASALNLANHLDPYVGKLASVNTNPPHLVAVMMPLTLFGRDMAYWVWTAISVACIAWAVRLAVRKCQLRITGGTVAVFLAFSGTFYQLASGQVAWFLTLPMTVAWSLGSTTMAGVLIGLCASIKPFLFLFGVYFLFKRQWVPVFGMALGAMSAVLLGVATVGFSAYVSWVQTLRDLNTAFLYSNGSLFGIVARMDQPGGLFLITPGLARGLWIAMAAAVCAVTFSRLRRQTDPDQEWALVLVTAMLMSPLGQPYYLALVLGPLWKTLGQLDKPRWGLGVSGLFWWPNVLTSPAIPTEPWQLVTYNLTTLGLISLWAVIAFSKPRTLEQPSSRFEQALAQSL